MRSSVFALVFIVSCSAALAQVTVPNTFAAGAPARAADVNANFQALVTAINSLGTRVSKLEGQIASSDLVGTYAINRFQSELGGVPSQRVAMYTSEGTANFAADGTCTLLGTTERGHQLNLPGGALSAFNGAQTGSLPCTWTFSGGKITAIGGTFSVVAGGRLLIRTSANPADGTNVLVLLTRTN